MTRCFIRSYMSLGTSLAIATGLLLWSRHGLAQTQMAQTQPFGQTGTSRFVDLNRPDGNGISPTQTINLQTPPTSTILLSSPSGSVSTGSTGKRFLQLHEANHPNVTFSEFNGKRLEISGSSQSVAARQTLSAVLQNLADGDIASAKSRTVEKIQQTNTANEALQIGEALTTLNLFGWADVAFQRAVTLNRSLQAIVDEWKRLFFPKTPLSEDLANTFANALYTDQPQNDRLSKLDALLKQQADYAPALQWRAFFTADPTQRVRIAQSAAQLAPDNLAALENWGDLAVKSRRMSEAHQAYSAAETLISNSPLAQSKGWTTRITNKKAALAGR